jgi:hypothetical protein
MASADIQKLVWIAAGILAVMTAAGLAWWLLRVLVFNRASHIFGGRERRRLALVEWSSIGGGRQLLLVRRDNMEHLIMTGGPIDVVVESGIGKEEFAGERAAKSPPVHADFPRFEDGEARGFESGRDAGGRRKTDEAAGADNRRLRAAKGLSSAQSDNAPLILTPEQAE